MFSNEKKINNLFIYWLTTSLVLIFCIIIIGGLTRLTNSGLSITEWELIKGIFPPTDELAWQKYFTLYREIPQFKLLNKNMNLNEFKIIFYWEYIHRILGRIIGIFFIIPLIFFHLSKKIDFRYLNVCYFLFCLILLQGFIGWYMVQSGLINNVSVSHYRLSVHLSIAIIIISSIFWLIKNFKSKKHIYFFKISKKNIYFLILISLIFLQIIFGAFVSGLDAGRIYQTWPLMGSSLIPDDTNFNNLKNFFDLNNHSLVQFYHRNLAYIIIFFILLLSLHIFKEKLTNLYGPMFLVIFSLCIQIILGILTLISGLNIYLASAHQITSVIFIFSAINLYYYTAK
jgi:heme a synthase